MNVVDLIRDNIRALSPYVSARDKYISGDLLDANENPFGSVGARENPLALNRYPDPAQRALRNSLGAYLDVDPARLFFGVGSDEIIDLLLRVFCQPARDAVAIFEPTYGMFRVAADVHGVETKRFDLSEDFQLPAELPEELKRGEAKLAFLCSPNNPVGPALRKSDVLNFARKFEGIVVVDEAYIDFAPDASVYRETAILPNLVVTRTFSKAWGLAGARCGYCVADPVVVDFLMKAKAPYSINKMTERAVLDALDRPEEKDEYVERIVAERERLAAALRAIDEIETVFPSEANFILVRTPGAPALQKRMAERGVIVRDRSSQPRLEDTIRISVGTAEENDRMLEALKASL